MPWSAYAPRVINFFKKENDNYGEFMVLYNRKLIDFQLARWLSSQRAHYWSHNAVGQEFEPVWPLNVALSKRQCFRTKCAKNNSELQSKLLCSSELFSLTLQSLTSISSAKRKSSKSSSFVSKSNVRICYTSTLTYPMLQPPFDLDVAHPITDVRLYPYKGRGVNYMQWVIFWTSRILLHLVKPWTPHLRPGKEY